MTTFHETHQALSLEATEYAHQIALCILHEMPDQITPTMLLDYAHSLHQVIAHLADNEIVDSGWAFTHTATQGPVVIESDMDGNYQVFRFDRTELTPEDVTDEDMAQITAAAWKATH